MTDLPPIDYSIKVPSDEDIQRLKAVYVQTKSELVAHLTQIIEQLQGENPISGSERKQLMGDIGTITTMINKFDRNSYEYWEALDLKANPNK